MLRLESLELIGFKSFADRTKVAFPDQITAIIGPNGCGKSNLSDAIGWVLGAQTAKSLRGQKMEDFIFGGTRSRRQSGLAEVKLVLRRNEASTVSLGGVEIDSETLEISRKVFRSGESQYFVNNRRCRLMDIHQFLEDAGLGFASYAMIAQGKIDSFLTAKPLDRRAVIEEAAQISGYKAKRRNAEMKLELSQQNLVRLNDIVSEVERQLRSLKRQANRTKRYQVVKEEFREVQRRRFAFEVDRFGCEIQQIDERLSELKKSEEKLTERLCREEKGFSRAADERDDREQKLSELRESRSQLTLELDRTHHSIEYHREQIEQIKEAMKTLESEREGLEESLHQFEGEWEDLHIDKAALEKEEKEIQLRFEEQQKVVNEHSEALEEAEEKLEEWRAKLLQISADSASKKNLKEQVAQRLKRITGERERLQEELTQSRKRLSETSNLRREKAEALEKLEEQFRALHQEVRTQKQAREEHSTQFEELGRKETEVRDRLVALKERLQSLQELEISRSHYSDGVKQVLNHFNKNKSISTEGTFADSIETSPEFERVVEEFLDEELEYILVDSLDEAVRGLSELKTLESGKATFLSIYSTNGFGKKQVPPRDGPEKGEGVYGRLAEVIQMKPELQDAFWRVLPQRADAVVVSDMDRAMQLAHSYPESTFITLEGESLTPRGLLSGTAPGSKRLGLLGLKRQKRELEKKVGSQQKALEKIIQERLERKEALEALASTLESTQTLLYETEKKCIGLRHEIEEADREVRRFERAAQALEYDLDRLVVDQQELTQKEEEVERALGELDKSKVEAEGRLTFGRQDLYKLRTALNQEQEKLNSIQSGRRVTEERKVALAKTLERLRSQKVEASNRLKTLSDREERYQTRQAELVNESKELTKSSEQLRTKKTEVSRSLEEAEADFLKFKEALKEIESRIGDLRDSRSEVLEQKSKIDIERARIETQFQNLEELCIDQLKVPIHEAIEKVDLAEFDADEVRERYEKLKDKIENFGPINMTALKEYEENEERHQFLTQQRSDIEQSIADTTKAIQEINRRSRARFTETFEAVNNNFKSVFQKLFGGGDCGMELLDEEDILECGIDVFAQPPGKKLQNIMLLSGGEKALTVFALLMGIFMYRPSRFCVLDEVDAPLDDANVKRFGQLIEDMSEETQFIIVTHNKRTMESADTLYGITMEEAGISKVVSAQF